MASILKSACIILSVFLSLDFSLAHRFLLDQANDDHKNMDPVHLEAVKNPNAEVGIGTGGGSGSGTGPGVGSGGSGYGIGIGSGPGASGYESGYGSGGCPGCVSGFTIPIPQIPRIQIPTIRIPPIQIPTIQIPGCGTEPCVGGGHTGRPIETPGVPGCVTGSCVRGGNTGGPIANCNPDNNNGLGNCQPHPHYEHQKPGGSTTEDAKVMKEAMTVSEPYPPYIDHSQP